jgi:endonuclease/exonuclease/phosphatase (EEP) superfamily protein YafD
MITLPQPTILDASALAGAEAAHHLATVLKTQWTGFWQRDPATVLADIEADLPKTLAIFALNTQAAEAINAILDAISDPRFTNRAPTTLPAHWSFDGEAFSYHPPVIEDPEEETPAA